MGPPSQVTVQAVEWSAAAAQAKAASRVLLMARQQT